MHMYLSMYLYECILGYVFFWPGLPPGLLLEYLLYDFLFFCVIICICVVCIVRNIVTVQLLRSAWLVLRLPLYCHHHSTK